MNAFTRFLLMTRRTNMEKPRLGKVTMKQKGDLTTYRVKVNRPKPRRLVVNSKLRKK